MNIDFTNIKAEVLLNYLYPNRKDAWIVENKGTFFRNYQADLMDINLDDNKVSLCRDNFISLLPENIFFRREVKAKKDVEFRRKEQIKEDRDNYESLCSIFAAIDTFRFRDSLEYEAFFSLVYENKMQLLLKEIYGYDYEKEQNKYVKKLSPLILQSAKIKGDIELIREILELLLSEEFNCKVKKKISEYRENAWRTCFLTQVIYYIIIPGLDKDNYKQLSQEFEPLFSFLKEWFLPIHLRTDFIIIDNDNEAISSRSLLGYNTKVQLKNNNL